MFTGMTGDHARSALAGTPFADVRWVAETGSTNADLLALARSSDADNVVLVADHQTAGRGRLDRTWEAPPGASLLMSVLVRPAVPIEQLHLLTMALGVAAADALREVAEAAVGLKWPNDLVAPTPEGERKLGGILAESVVADGEVEAVVIGLGINVAWGADVPEELRGIAVALDQLGDAEGHGHGHAVDREDLLVMIIEHFAERYADLANPQLVEDYLDHCWTLGRQVRVETAAGIVEGRADEIRDTGHLVVETAAGERVDIAVGDVVHLRPG